VPSDHAYRRRLQADLSRWEAEGLLPASAAAAIRGKLEPLPEGITISTVVAIVGGLLIAAAFLAFIAANWAATARPARFGILLAGIIGAYAASAWFDRNVRPALSDLAAGVGAIIFGAAIAFAGQMYHLGDDFAGGLLLWAAGALVAAVLTESRGALAVAVVAGCLWSGARSFEISDVHPPFVGFWFACALLACAWNSAVARHLVAVSAVVWWVLTGIGLDARAAAPAFAVGAGSALMLGGGLALATLGPNALRAFGHTLSNYGALALATALPAAIAGFAGSSSRGIPLWTAECGGAGLVLAFVGSALGRRAGPALAGFSAGFALLVLSEWIKPPANDEPWLTFALALASMLCLVVSGMLDGVRVRVVAGWIGLAGVIAAITWAVKGSLVRRSAFLAAAGLVASVLARLLGRLVPEESPR
jgi:uncharacterized membrane protein